MGYILLEDVSRFLPYLSKYFGDSVTFLGAYLSNRDLIRNEMIDYNKDKDLLSKSKINYDRKLE